MSMPILRGHGVAHQDTEPRPHGRSERVSVKLADVDVGMNGFARPPTAELASFQSITGYKAQVWRKAGRVA